MNDRNRPNIGTSLSLLVSLLLPFDKQSMREVTLQMNWMFVEEVTAVSHSSPSLSIILSYPSYPTFQV